MSVNAYPLIRQQDIVIQEFKDEILIYDLRTNKAFSLNETSALIWRECDGNKSVAEISRTLNKKLNKKSDENLVWLAIDGFKKENLLANSEEIVPDFNGRSRREVIRAVGLGTMAALPLIASVNAPTAAMAQSVETCVPLGESCVDLVNPGMFLTCCTGPNVICCGTETSAFCIDELLGGGDCGVTN